MTTRDFYITDDHIKLLKRMYVTWYDCEYGAPCVDPKRPYGNSDVEGDICEILKWEDNDENLDKARDLHREDMEIVVQIALSNPCEDIRGLWVDERGYGYDWGRATKSHQKNYEAARLQKQIEEMEAQAAHYEFKMQALRGDIEERLLPKLNEMLAK